MLEDFVIGSLIVTIEIWNCYSFKCLKFFEWKFILFYIFNGYDKNLSNQFLVIFNFIGLDFDIWEKNNINGYQKNSNN
jgi:hypothetical protein